MKGTFKKVLTGLMASALILAGFAGCSMASSDESSKSAGAAVEPVVFSTSGTVASGTTVTLRTATSDAVIFYAFDTELTSANASSAGTRVSKSYIAIDITKSTTIYAIAYKSGSWSDPTNASFTVVAGDEGESGNGGNESVTSVTAGRVFDMTKGGTDLVLYYPNGKLALGTEVKVVSSTKNTLAGVEATVENDVVTVTQAALLTATVDENGYYTFTCNGKYLTSGAAGSNLTFEDSSSDYSLWTLEETAEGSGTFYIKNVNAKYNETTPQYIEYYSSSTGGSFTTYGLNSYSDPLIYQYQFFKKDAAAETNNSYVDYVSFSATGKVDNGTKVALSTTTEGAAIYYSIDEELTADNYETTGTVYTSEIEITKACTIYAIAVKGTNKSEVKSAEYTLSASIEEDEGSLLANGGFEIWDSDKAAANWVPTTSAGGATVSKSTAEVHSGSYSLLIAQNSSNKRVAYKEMTLEAGKYTFSVYAKLCTAGTASSFSLRPGYVPVVDGAAVSSSYTYGDYQNINSDSWTLISNTFELTEETTLNLVIMNPKNTGSVYIDDAKLVKVEDSGEEVVEPSETVTATLASSIKDGDTVVLYNLKNNMALTSTVNGYKLNGVKATVNDELITLTDDIVRLTVEQNGDSYSFKNADGNYLTALGNEKSTSGTLKFAEKPTDDSVDYTLFTLSTGSVDGAFYLTSVNATCYSSKTSANLPAMVEYYNGFSSYIEGTGTAYDIYFYTVNE